MARIYVLYATRHGHAKKVAEHVARVLREQQALPVMVAAVAELAKEFTLDDTAGVVLVASIHVGSHEREMLTFVKRQRERLAPRPSALLSLSMSQAGVQDLSAPADKRASAQRDVEMMLERFCKASGFRPDHMLPVAGALMYTHYNPFVRFVMKRISRAAGGPTDTSRDYEFTDWDALSAFARAFGNEVAEPQQDKARAAPSLAS